MITTHFNKEKGILKTVWTGNVDLKQIVDYIDTTRLNKDYPRRLKILTIASDVHLDLSPNDLHKIVEANMKSLDKYEMIIDGIILEKPLEMALSILYQKLSATNKYLFSVFSATQSAMDWLESIE